MAKSDGPKEPGLFVLGSHRFCLGGRRPHHSSARTIQFRFNSPPKGPVCSGHSYRGTKRNEYFGPGHGGGKPRWTSGQTYPMYRTHVLACQDYPAAGSVGGVRAAAGELKRDENLQHMCLLDMPYSA
jgi:hypothetical protein